MARAHPGHRGAARLARALVEHDAGTTLTRSELEERFLALCDAYGRATRAGYRTLRFTHRRIATEPHAVAATVAAALAQRAAAAA